MRYKTIVATFIFVLLVHITYANAQESGPANCTGKIVVDGMTGWTKYDDYSPLYKGYCNHYGYWVFGLITREFWKQSAPTHFVTRALYAWDHMLINTGEDLTGYEGGISLYTCEDIGKTAYIRHANSGRWYKMKVVDCVNREHQYTHVLTGTSGLEISSSLGRSWGGDETGLWNVEVYISETQPSDNPGTPVSLQKWWMDNATFVGRDGEYVATLSQIMGENPKPG